MRVIAGTARGRALKSPPKGRRGEPPPTRPTSDLVRGAIFDMLDAMGAVYALVLDLYAGTGALGIEALSRGDGRADFVESDTRAAAVIRANLELTAFSERARVLVARVERVAPRLAGPYTLVLADPPYTDEHAVAAIASIAASPLVDTRSVLVLEHGIRTTAAEAFGALTLYRTREHGDTAVSIYCSGGECKT